MLVHKRRSAPWADAGGRVWTTADVGLVWGVNRCRVSHGARRSSGRRTGIAWPWSTACQSGTIRSTSSMAFADKPRASTAPGISYGSTSANKHICVTTRSAAWRSCREVNALLPWKRNVSSASGEGPQYQLRLSDRGRAATTQPWPRATSVRTVITPPRYVANVTGVGVPFAIDGRVGVRSGTGPSAAGKAELVAGRRSATDQSRHRRWRSRLS